jgi:hypothetical protein
MPRIENAESFLNEGELGFFYTRISEYNHNHRHINNTESVNQIREDVGGYTVDGGSMGLLVLGRYSFLTEGKSK